MKIENRELINITGGAVNVNGTLLNAAGRVIDAIMDVGRSLGTVIRNIYSGTSC